MDWIQAADLVMQGVMSSVLSENVSYRKADTLDWFTVQGVFSRQYTGIDSDTGSMYTGQQPAVTVRDLDIPNGPEVGDFVIARNVSYRVDKIEVDGQSAGTGLMLKKTGNASP